MLGEPLDAPKDCVTGGELVALLCSSDMVSNVKPDGMLRFAEFLNRIGIFHTRPKVWTEYCLPVVAALGVT